LEIILKDIPKISLNQWYAGNKHWSERKKIKDKTYWIVKSQCKIVFSKNKQYEVSYRFIFKNNPLDSSNTVSMVKILEDILFEDDKYDIVKKICTSSEKGKQDMVIINIKEL
jgi:hypothetical protein